MTENAVTATKMNKKKNWKHLRLSLKFRPKIFRLILKMRQSIRQRNYLIKTMKNKLQQMEKNADKESINKSSSQMDFIETTKEETSIPNSNITYNDAGRNSKESTKESSPRRTETTKEETSIPNSKIACYDASRNTTESSKEFSPRRTETTKEETSVPNSNTANTDASTNIKQSTKESSTQTDLIQITDEKSVLKSNIPNNDAARNIKLSTKESSTQTDLIHITEEKSLPKSNNSNNDASWNRKEENSTPNSNITDAGWNLDKENGEKEMSIADQVKEVAQNALKETGMVYVESAGMYYDYKTGYYYNSELGLYYHTDTNCYYYYSDEKQQFVFHSYPDTSAVNASLLAHQKKKARKLKRDDGKPKRKRTKKNIPSDVKNKDENRTTESEITETVVKESVDSENKSEEENKELEDGECSDSASEISDCESDGSTSTLSDEDSVSKHHPPCMRVIVRQTNLPKLKVGSLFLITKDGGTVGREGDQHTILIRDHNVSRNHLDIRYDTVKKTYVVTDLGSKNGTILNGTRMSESQEISNKMEVLHGSTIQLGETKLLCHIHPGNDTCGHCEPGLLLETEEKEKKAAYTRTCSVQKQHQLELARLKNIYAPKLLEIEEKPYNDRAQARRETVGSTSQAEKTQTSDLDTCISQENKGFKLLEKMGWSKGEGLGKDNQGDTEPVPLVSNEGKAGLGTTGAMASPPVVPTIKKTNTLASATLRLASRTKMLQPPAKAFQNNDLDEDSD